jgi:hypothetical protein
VQFLTGTAFCFEVDAQILLDRSSPGPIRRKTPAFETTVYFFSSSRAVYGKVGAGPRFPVICLKLSSIRYGTLQSTDGGRLLRTDFPDLALSLAAGADRTRFPIPAPRRVLVCQFEYLFRSSSAGWPLCAASWEMPRIKTCS